MKWAFAIAFVGFALFQAYNLGWAQAVKRHPEYKATKEADREADARFWADLADQETERDRVCDEIIDSVSDLLRIEYNQ